MIYAVIDTNVIVSALITKNSEAATIHVIRAVLNGQVVPVYNKADTDPFGSKPRIKLIFTDFSIRTQGVILNLRLN